MSDLIIDCENMYTFLFPPYAFKYFSVFSRTYITSELEKPYL